METVHVAISGTELPQYELLTAIINSFCVGGLHASQAHVVLLSSFLHSMRSVRHAICEVSAGQPGCAERQVFEAPQHSPTVINNSSGARGGGLQVPVQ